MKNRSKIKAFVFLCLCAVLGFFIIRSYIAHKQAPLEAAPLSQTQKVQNQLDDIDIFLSFRARRWRLTANDLAINSDIHTVLLDIYRRKGYKTYQQKLAALERISQMGFSGDIAIKYLFPTLDQKLDEIICQIDKEPIPAKIEFFPERKPSFIIQKEVEGYKVDKAQLLAQIERAYKKSNKIRLEIMPQILQSEVTAEVLKQATYLRSRFSTEYASSGENRKHNVALALKKFNGKTVESGEQISFNKTVGARNEANGFREAKIIRAGRFEDGVGGGVCQSSTTIYNAALLAGLEIIEVNQHSLQVSYVSPSFDAMVNSGRSDLIFKNNTDLPVFIKTYCTDKKVFVEIYGTKMPYKIVRESEEVAKIPDLGDEFIVDTEGKYAQQAPYKDEKVRIQSPKQGLKSRGYLKYYSPDGKLIEKKLIRKNTYAPQKGLVVEGTKPKPPTSIVDYGKDYDFIYEED